MDRIKVFEKLKDGRLKVIITNEDELKLPMGAKYETIGTFTDLTEWYVDAENISKLHMFILKQKNEVSNQLDAMRAKLEQLKDVKDDMIPQEFLEKLIKLKTDNSKRSEMMKLKHLDLYLGQVIEKKNVELQIKHLEKQNEEINIDLLQFDKIIVKQ